MRIFLAGIMQGSRVSADLHEQNYRTRFRASLETFLPEYEVYDPLEFHANSLDYENSKGRDVFLHHNRMCSNVDLLVAHVPEASMGTAIEMWEAWRHDKLVISISPMKHNWAVKFLSHILFEQEAEFLNALEDGSLRQRLVQLGATIAKTLP